MGNTLRRARGNDEEEEAKDAKYAQRFPPSAKINVYFSTPPKKPIVSLSIVFGLALVFFKVRVEQNL